MLITLQIKNALNANSDQQDQTMLMGQSQMNIPYENSDEQHKVPGDRKIVQPDPSEALDGQSQIAIKN